jgi:hypothetical protein
MALRISQLETGGILDSFFVMTACKPAETKTGSTYYTLTLRDIGGTVTANYLSINTGGGAKMTIGGSGSFIAPVSNLSNINYWITNNAITAEGGLSGWSINVDRTSQSGFVVLTAVPEPSVSLLATAAMGGCCFFRSRRKAACLRP